MKVSLFLSFLLVGLVYSCHHDSECPGGCCIHLSDGTFKCEMLGDGGDVCDLEGQGLAGNVCGCKSGLKCAKIDLTDFGVIAATVNPIFEKHHYGICEPEIVNIG